MAKKLVGAAAAARKCKGKKNFKSCVRKHARKGKKSKK